jgi:hypothetical protein
MFLDYFALGTLIAVAVILFYGIIAIPDIPSQVAMHRHMEPFVGTSLAFCEWRVA